jgi:hypothetical protein
LIPSWLTAADPITVATLAGVMLLEGIRRVPDGGLVLRRSLGGGWEASVAGRSRLALLSWWAPFSIALVCAEPSADGSAQGRHLASRGHAIRWHLRLLATLGGATLLAVVLGIPILTARLGGRGFIGGTAIAFLLSCFTAATGFASLLRLGVRPRRAAARALGWCWPFNAPHAERQLLEQAAAGAPPLSVARWLLRPDDFASWIRPRAWDALHGHDDVELAASVGDDELESLVNGPPPGIDPYAPAYCPRCAASWRMPGRCPACDVELRAAPHAAPGSYSTAGR